MYFVEDCLLYSLLCLVVNHLACTIFHLHRLNATPANMFPQGKIQPSQKSSIFFPLNYSKDLAPILSCLEASIEMLLPMSSPMLPKVFAFHLVDPKSELDIFNGKLEWCLDLASP
jgi:hypothetical protein